MDKLEVLAANFRRRSPWCLSRNETLPLVFPVGLHDVQRFLDHTTCPMVTLAISVLELPEPFPNMVEQSIPRPHSPHRNPRRIRSSSASQPSARMSAPERGERRNAPAGLDLTFSADKSVSAVWRLRESVCVRPSPMRTPRRSNTRSSKSSQAHCATTRIRTRTLSGARGELAIVPADLIAALFQHGTSRADDPQLHTHCTVMNAARVRTSTGSTAR